MTTAKEDSTAADAAPKGTTPGAAMDSVVHLYEGATAVPVSAACVLPPRGRRLCGRH